MKLNLQIFKNSYNNKIMFYFRVIECSFKCCLSIIVLSVLLPIVYKIILSAISN